MKTKTVTAWIDKNWTGYLKYDKDYNFSIIMPILFKMKGDGTGDYDELVRVKITIEEV